jgi:hypothetical protein
VFEADISPPSNAELKNELNYKSTSPYAFMAWNLVKRFYLKIVPVL